MIYKRRRLIDFAPRNHWLFYGGIVINHCLPLSSSFSCGNSSSSSNIVNANASRRLERLELERASIYELTKARWRNKEDPQLSEKDIISGVFGPLFSSIFHTFFLSNNIDIVGVENSNHEFEESHVQRQQSTRLVKGSDDSAVNKSKPSRTEAQAGTSENETDILSSVIRYEQELGREPELTDLLCRFSRQEIHMMWDSLLWLYPHLKEELVLA